MARPKKSTTKSKSTNTPNEQEIVYDTYVYIVDDKLNCSADIYRDLDPGDFDDDIVLNGPVDFQDVTTYLNDLKKDKLFEGKSGQVFALRLNKKKQPKNIVLVGVGDDFESNYYPKLCPAFGKATSKLIELKAEKVLLIASPILELEGIAKAYEAMYLKKYCFNKYKVSPDEYNPNKMQIDVRYHYKNQVLDNLIFQARVLSVYTNLAKNLVNEPPNKLTPISLANFGIEMSKKMDIEIEILNREDIENLNMTALLTVSQGSKNDPCVLVMRYMNGEEDDPIIGLIGKGLTYDSGGYCIKPPSGMDTMKCDMGGAATVISAICTMSIMQVKKNVVAVVAACENMISGEAYRPGDIIKSMSGKTIEIVNTDAEGRLTLADAITYAIEKENVDVVIDVATLTGACVVALGNDITGVLTNDNNLWESLEGASRIANEKLWRLPCDLDIAENNKSKVANLKNSGGRDGGAISAGLFVKEFTQGKPWVHMDIAGTAFNTSDTDTCQRGGTGVGVRTLFHLVDNMQ